MTKLCHDTACCVEDINQSWIELLLGVFEEECAGCFLSPLNVAVLAGEELDNLGWRQRHQSNGSEKQVQDI
jgi:hypothetical protein